MFGNRVFLVMLFFWDACFEHHPKAFLLNDRFIDPLVFVAATELRKV